MPFLFLLTLGPCSTGESSLQLSMLAKGTQFSRLISDDNATEMPTVPWFGDMLGGGGGQCFLLEYSDAERGLSCLQLFQAGFLLSLQLCEFSGLSHVIYVWFQEAWQKRGVP